MCKNNNKEEKLQCLCCNDYYCRDNFVISMRSINGEERYICRSCNSRIPTECDICGKLGLYCTSDVNMKIEVKNNIDTQKRCCLCLKCKEKYYECCICEKAISKDPNNFISVEDGVGSFHTVCKECYNNNMYNICRECGTITKYYDTMTIDGDPYCYCCYEKLRDEYNLSEFTGDESKLDSVYVKGYHKHEEEDLIFHKLTGEKNNRFFGVEDEMENGLNMFLNLNKLVKFHKDFYYEHDCSLGENDRECISHPRTISSWKKLYETGKLKNLLDIFKDARFESEETDTCGMHIHVSRKGFGDTKDEQRINIAKTIIMSSLLYRDFILDIASRGDVEYSKHISRYDIKEILNGVYNPYFGFRRYNWKNCDLSYEERDFIDKLMHKCEYHSCATNTSNNKTVEFRFFRGTLDTETYYKRIIFLNNMIDFSCQFSISELLTMNRIDASVMFSKYIRSH